MIQHPMFTEEAHIRNTLQQLRTVVLNEQERFHSYCHKATANANVVKAMKGKISVLTETSNLLTGYLTDYTVNLHGVLRYLREAEEEVKIAQATLLYMDKLHEHRAMRNAIDKAEQIAYTLMGKQIELLEPTLRAMWSEELDKEIAIYQQMVAERKGASYG